LPGVLIFRDGRAESGQVGFRHTPILPPPFLVIAITDFQSVTGKRDMPMPPARAFRGGTISD